MASPLFDTIFSMLSKSIEKSGRLEKCSEDFAVLASDQERFSFVNSLPETLQFTVQRGESKRGGKSAQKAAEYRNEGNKHFGKKNYPEAIKSYTKSASFADVNFVDNKKQNALALAFANRSAALFYANDYRSCLKDIDLAFEHDYPEAMAYKLMERKGKVYLVLQKFTDARKSFEDALESIKSSGLDENKLTHIQKEIQTNLEVCDKVDKLKKEIDTEDFLALSLDNTNRYMNCPKLEKSCPRFPSLSSAVDVAHNSEQGRHIVAKRDIEPGEVILVEKPYASCLLPENYASHCYNCMRRSISSVPCDTCASALFCSKACKKEAMESYHQHECCVQPNIIDSGIGKFGYLALRAVTVKPIEFYRNFTPTSNNSPKYLGTDPKSGDYKYDDYNAIYHLVTHDTDRPVHDLFRRAAMSVYLTKCLQMTGYLPIDDPMTDFIGGLILSHLQLMPCNAHEISELELDQSSVVTSTTIEVGAGIYSSLSLFNHSCNPAVTRNFYSDCCVVRTIRPVQKGEELSDNYGALYPVHNKQERREKLSPQYYFDCRCRACEADWPMYMDIHSGPPEWACTSCGGSLGTRTTSEVTCSKCSTKQNLIKQSEGLLLSNSSYQGAFTNLLAGKFEDAMPVFCKHLSYIRKNVVLPWREFNDCQEGLKQCFNSFGNCHVNLDK